MGDRYTLAHRAVDLSAGEALLEIPPVPITQEANLSGTGGFTVEGSTLASFHGPQCSCGRPFGITYDLDRMVRHGTPNETLLHELVHAWQYHRDPHNFAERSLDVFEYGYWNAPHEVEARELAALMDEAGVRVWFPERIYA